MKINKKHRSSARFDTIGLGLTFRLEATFESPIFMKIASRQTSVPIEIAVDLATGLAESVMGDRACYLTVVECTEL